MQIFRISDERHPVWDGTGAALIGGRWNSPGRQVIYGATNFASAMLEVLAHANIGRLPKSQVFVVATVPNNLTIERVESASLPSGWDSDNCLVARRFGDLWLDEKRSALLLVPSVVARQEFNVLVNPNHPDSHKLKVAAPQKVIWDKRLFMR
jgi:RES domain-containing protein